MGWDNNVHVPVHTQARQQALLFHHQLLLGLGGVDNNVHVPVHTHRHGKLITFLAVLQTQAQLFHHQLLLRWGEVRWGGVG